MKIELMIAMMVSLLTVAALGAFKALRRRNSWEACANGYSESPHPDGRIARAMITEPSSAYLLMKVGAGGAADICGATDDPLGPCLDTPNVGERGTILHLGSAPGTKTMIASKAIADGDLVYTAANGKITDTSVTGCYLVGKAVEAASADGDEIEVDACFPIVQP